MNVSSELLAAAGQLQVPFMYLPFVAGAHRVLGVVSEKAIAV